MNNTLKRFIPVIVNKNKKYYVGYIDGYAWSIFSGHSYVVIIGENPKTDYLLCKYKEVIKIVNQDYLLIENNNEK